MLVIGNSMLEGLHERKMSSKRVVKVIKFSGATTDDIYHYLMPSLQKQQHNVILHVGTNEPFFLQFIRNCEQYTKTKIVHISKVIKCKCYFIETDYEIRHSSWKGYY